MMQDMQVWEDKKKFNSKEKKLRNLLVDPDLLGKSFESAPNPLEIATNQCQTLGAAPKPFSSTQDAKPSK